MTIKMTIIVAPMSCMCQKILLKCLNGNDDVSDDKKHPSHPPSDDDMPSSDDSANGTSTYTISKFQFINCSTSQRSTAQREIGKQE